MNTYLILLLIANILASLPPLFLNNLADRSVFLLTFTRFLDAAVIEFIIIVIMFILRKRELEKIYRNVYRSDIKSNGKAGYGDSGIKSGPSGNFISIRTFFRLYFVDYLGYINGKFGVNMKMGIFFALQGFIFIGLFIPLFYFGYVTLGVTLTTVVISVLSIVVIAFLNAVGGEEELNSIQGIFLVLIITSIFTSAFGREKTEIHFDFYGFVFVIITTACWIVFVKIAENSTNFPENKNKATFPDYRNMSETKDIRNTKSTLLYDLDNMHAGGIVPFMRAFVQLFWIHIFGIISIYPVTLIGLLSGPTGGGFAEHAAEFITSDLNVIANLCVNGGIIATAVICTVIAYFLMYLSAAIWPPHALKHSQWNSIFALLEPIFGLILGVTVWNEHIKTDYLALSFILLICGVFIRYYYETKTIIRFFVFLKTERNFVNDNYGLRTLLEIRGIERISAVCGSWDYILQGFCRSPASYNGIITEIRRSPLIKKMEYGIIRGHITPD